jgi:beta-lactamase regulating signal transducer with metallopeptidase domain
MYRWLKWAVLENMIDPADYFMPIRYLRVISPLKECANDKSNEEQGVSVQVIQQPKSVKTKSQNISDSLNTAEAETAEDISQWIDLINLAPYITKAYLFYKLEYFQCSIQVTGDIVKTASEERKTIATKEIKKEKEGDY